jgi:hypothetical protein
MHLLASESIIEAEGDAADPASLARSVADALAGRIPAASPVSAEVAVDAAMAGERPGRPATADALAARFGRPGAFHVMFSGDVAPDTLIAAVAPVLGRIRAGVSGIRPDSARAAAVAVSVEIPDDGRGSRALVGFRARVDGPTADRRPDQVLAGLDVLAQTLVLALEADGLTATHRSALVDDRATIVVEVRSNDPAGAAPRLLAAARGLAITEATVARARGRAVDAAESAMARPAGWIEWLDFISSNAVDPRAIHHYARTLRAVPVDRVRALASTLFDPIRAGVVVVGRR